MIEQKEMVCQVSALLIKNFNSMSPREKNQIELRKNVLSSIELLQPYSFWHFYQHVMTFMINISKNFLCDLINSISNLRHYLKHVASILGNKAPNLGNKAT